VIGVSILHGKISCAPVMIFLLVGGVVLKMVGDRAEPFCMEL